MKTNNWGKYLHDSFYVLGLPVALISLIRTIKKEGTDAVMEMLGVYDKKEERDMNFYIKRFLTTAGGDFGATQGKLAGTVADFALNHRAPSFPISDAMMQGMKLSRDILKAYSQYATGERNAGTYEPKFPRTAKRTIKGAMQLSSVISGLGYYNFAKFALMPVALALQLKEK